MSPRHNGDEDGMSDMCKCYISKQCSESHRRFTEPATNMLFVDANNSEQRMQIALYVREANARFLRELVSKLATSSTKDSV